LRMTGSLLWNPAGEPRHTRVLIHLEPRARLAITDPRRFGTGQLVLGTDALEAFFDARLGLEPLDERFTPEHLRAVAKGRRTPIRRCSSISAGSPGWETSMPTRRSTALASIRFVGRESS